MFVSVCERLAVESNTADKFLKFVLLCHAGSPVGRRGSFSRCLRHHLPVQQLVSIPSSPASVDWTLVR